MGRAEALSMALDAIDLKIDHIGDYPMDYESPDALRMEYLNAASILETMRDEEQAIEDEETGD